jgi:hypothetical protein
MGYGGGRLEGEEYNILYYFCITKNKVGIYINNNLIELYRLTSLVPSGLILNIIGENNKNTIPIRPKIIYKAYVVTIPVSHFAILALLLLNMSDIP